MFRDSLIGLPAPEFPENLTWLNGPSLTMAGLQGRVALIDFWTYSCVNCIRTLPHLASWHERYKDLGLVIIGVHTPEFAFEKDPHNVKDALKRFGISYPVVIDSDYLIWNLYSNHYWPRKLLINQEGVFVYDHAGEGDYARTEREIQMLIRRGHKDAKLPEIEAEEGSGPPSPRPMSGLRQGEGGICYPMTPEIYLGYSRGRVGNPEQKMLAPYRAGGSGSGLKDGTQDLIFHDRGDYKKDTWYLHGRWRISAEYIEHIRETGLYEDYIALQFSGAEVNLVMESERAAVLEVTLDNKPVELTARGADITHHQGKTFVMAKEPRMYRLISAKKLLSGVLKISVKERGVRAYAFTFGGCV